MCVRLIVIIWLDSDTIFVLLLLAVSYLITGFKYNVNIFMWFGKFVLIYLYNNYLSLEYMQASNNKNFAQLTRNTPGNAPRLHEVRQNIYDQQADKKSKTTG